MKDHAQPVILLIGSNGTLTYLLGRFADHCGYQLVVDNFSLHTIKVVNPAVIIFLSTRLLEMAQTVVEELANLDIPIIVCGSVADQARAKELGADDCLLHPLTYDDFQAALTDVRELKRA
jgi:hypothetical protein